MVALCLKKENEKKRKAGKKAEARGLWGSAVQQ